MNDETLQLLTDLHLHNDRQGPGSPESFMHMLTASGVDVSAPLQIADIGCGTGSTTLPLLAHTRASVTAVDFLQPFLEKLEATATEAGMADRLTTLCADMAALPFADEQFDIIWSEGAIYNVGFEAGLTDWKRFLKPKGVIVVSEITWLTENIPEELRTHWEAEYPEVATAEDKKAVLAEAGYELLEYFALPPADWTEHYYDPIAAGLNDFLARHEHSDAAEAIAEAERAEAALYEKYQDYYSYGVYIARKR